MKFLLAIILVIFITNKKCTEAQPVLTKEYVQYSLHKSSNDLREFSKFIIQHLEQTALKSKNNFNNLTKQLDYQGIEDFTFNTNMSNIISEEAIKLGIDPTPCTREINENIRHFLDLIRNDFYKLNFFIQSEINDILIVAEKEVNLKLEGLNEVVKMGNFCKYNLCFLRLITLIKSMRHDLINIYGEFEKNISVKTDEYEWVIQKGAKMATTSFTMVSDSTLKCWEQLKRTAHLYM